MVEYSHHSFEVGSESNDNLSKNYQNTGDIFRKSMDHQIKAYKAYLFIKLSEIF